MIHKEATNHTAFECEVRFRLEKPMIKWFLFKHLILDCGEIDHRRDLKPIISTFSQAEASIVDWFSSGRWLKYCCDDEDMKGWGKYTNDPSAFGEVEIVKMAKKWFYFLQNPQDFMHRPDVCWIQVNSNLRIWVESAKRPITNQGRTLVAIPSTEKNQYGGYMLTDYMKEQAVSIVRNYYSYALKDYPKADIELSADRKYKDYVVCAER